MLKTDLKEGDIISVYDFRCGTYYNAIVTVPPVFEDDGWVVGTKFIPKNKDFRAEDRDEDGYWYHYAISDEKNDRWEDGDL